MGETEHIIVPGGECGYLGVTLTGRPGFCCGLSV